MGIITNNEVIEVSEEAPDSSNNKKVEMKGDKKKSLTIQDKSTGERKTITAQEVLIATGRGPNTDILHPERAGIETDKDDG